MAVRPVRIYGDPVLRQKARELGMRTLREDGIAFAGPAAGDGDGRVGGVRPGVGARAARVDGSVPLTVGSL
mgnify:CR=1 FL=1